MLAEGWAANLSLLRPLQQRARLTTAEAAKLCGVSLRTYRRWLRDECPSPGAVRLLALVAGFVPFQGWDGWEFDNGCLFPPGYSKNGITPGDFFALVFLRQLVSTYREDNGKLRDRVRELEAKLEASDASSAPQQLPDIEAVDQRLKIFEDEVQRLGKLGQDLRSELHPEALRDVG